MSQAATAKEALERAAKTKTRIRVFYGDPVTGKDDCDETDRRGKVTKTKASAFVLAISVSHDSKHGNRLHTIDTSRVVRVVKYGRGARKPTELYRHPNYTTGKWSSYYRSDLGKWIAIRNGLIHATFNNEIDSALYVDYIQGNRERIRYINKPAAFKAMLRRKTK